MDIKAVLIGENKLTPVFNQVEQSGKKSAEVINSAFAKSISVFDLVKNAVLGVGISFSAWKVADYIKDSALLAARYETLGVTMEVIGNNAGYTSSQMSGFQAELEKMGIAAVESRQNLTAMSQAHINLANSAQLARIAQDAAVIGATNSSEALTKLVYGIQSAQTDVLRTIGINVNFEDSYKKLASQIGKTSDELTEEEKVQARVNAVLERGKDIAGAYEAAMGTTGKQITSLQRYMDNLKVAIGETFGPALSELIPTVTDKLKGMNSWFKNNKETVSELGGVTVGIFRTIDAALRTISGSAVAYGMTIYQIVSASKNLFTGEFSTAKKDLMEIKGIWSTYIDDVKGSWSRISFSPKKSSPSLNTEAEAQRIDKGRAARSEAEAAAAAEQKEKQFLDNIKNSITNVKDYTSAMKDLGSERLNASKSGYSDKLSDEIDLFKEGKAELSDLTTTVKKYGITVNDVFNQRLSGAEDSLKRISDLYSELKGKISKLGQTEEAKKAGVEILKEYKSTAEKIIAVEQSRYKTLLAGEDEYANKLLATIKTKKTELESLRKEFASFSKTLEEEKRTVTGDYSGGYGYLDPNLDAYSKRLEQIAKLQRDEATAWKISDVSGREEALKKVISGYDSLKSAVESTVTTTRDFVDTSQGFTATGFINTTSEIKTSLDTIVTKEQAVSDAQTEQKRIYEQMISSRTSNLAEMQTEYEKTLGKIDLYKTKLEDLDNILKNLTKTVTIDLKVNGLEQIGKIQSFVGQATTSIFSSSSSSSDSGWDWYSNLPTYASGTNYVPKTGLAIVHKGEKITPASQNSTTNNNSKNSNISFGDIIIQTSATDADSIAREAMPAIRKHLTRMGYGM